MENSFPSLKTIFIFLLFLLMVFCFQAKQSEAQSGLLPTAELDALKEVATQVGKTDWDFNSNPCGLNNQNWNTPKNDATPNYNNSVVCNCTFSGGVCHVQKIFLKGQDLAGVLPPSLAKLPFVTAIDFTRNYLSGTIPSEWSSLSNLQYLSVTVNHLSGPIPDFLGNMTSIIYMSLETNNFNGSIPASIGKMTNLVNLILSYNNLTGVIPTELSNLKNLTELRLSNNNFTGNLILFDTWTKLQKLEIIGSGFAGPIPSNISVFTNLTELRISDLNGGGSSSFPLLNNMINMTKLILRGCNLSGNIPPYISGFGGLQMLDLSFNNLDGPLPDIGQKSLVLYLTGNSLSGPVPNWIINRDSKSQMDLSYNNFDVKSFPPESSTLNLYRGFGNRNHSKLSTYFVPPTCSKDCYEIHINCGGKATTIGDTHYEGDESSAGNTIFFAPKEYWGGSNTGDFYGRPTISLTNYTATNTTVLNVNNAELFTTARLSPISLAYYGRCLVNGNYTVSLQFAEIVFTSNRSYQSLGIRKFDVYIQDKLQIKDFDIENAAGGVNKVFIQRFNSVAVTDRVLEIRFQYTGKGTTAVPVRGNYGPLISAISIKSEFDPPSNAKKKRTIAIASSASAFFVILLICLAAWKIHSNNKISREKELRGLDLRTGRFTYRQIRAATDDFSAANKIGEGGFGPVYKGTLLDGKVIAVKRLSPKSKQGNREFVNEIGMISVLQHPNVVRLYGCCVEGNQLLLVYEYLENDNLANALFGKEEAQLDLDWKTRQRICLGIAKGLSFLHDESAVKIVHRDIKGNNVLLDKDLNPKISDFGLAKLDEQENSHITTRVAGTIGYMAPEYALWGYLTYKADVYSFGIVALEIVAGKNNMQFRPSDDYVCLLDWALVLQKNGSLMELVDPKLGNDYDKEESLNMIKIALSCTNPSPALRPKMSDVVSMLEGKMSIQEFNSGPNINDGDDKLNFQSLREKYDEMQLRMTSSESEPLVSSYERKDSSTFSISTSV